MTTPSATIISDGNSRRPGSGCRSAARHSDASSAASVARAPVRKSGAKPSSAARVAGSEPLKMVIPMAPLPQPSIDPFM